MHLQERKRTSLFKNKELYLKFFSQPFGVGSFIPINLVQFSAYRNDERKRISKHYDVFKSTQNGIIEMVRAPRNSSIYTYLSHNKRKNMHKHSSETATIGANAHQIKNWSLVVCGATTPLYIFSFSFEIKNTERNNEDIKLVHFI